MTTQPNKAFVEHLKRSVEIGVGIRARVFCWLPKRLVNGRIAWLRKVWRIVEPEGVKYED